jgi:hypothetical protein
VLELDSDVVSHLESVAIVVVGTVAGDGVPEATRGWRVSVDTSAAPTLRIFLPVSAERTRANLEETGRIAVTVTDPDTYRSTQVKGRAIRQEELTPADEQEGERFFASLAAMLHELQGTDLVAFDRARPGPLYATVATIEEYYDQTPGPAAGVRLAPNADGT